MADVKNQGAKAPQAPKAPPATPPAAPTPPVTATAPKPKKVAPNPFFDTKEEMEKELATRTSGPRNGFIITDPKGVVHHVIHTNIREAAGVLAMKHGYKAEEFGKKPRAAKVQGVDGILAAINALPEAERAAVRAQLGL